MHDILLLAHLIGLMMGAGGGFGSTIAMGAAAKAPPERASVLFSLGPAYAAFSAIGLAVMWASGVLLVVTTFPLEAMPILFWVKMAFVLALTLAAIAVHLTYGAVKKGDAKAAARLKMLGPISGISSLLAVVFAVFAFH